MFNRPSSQPALASPRDPRDIRPSRNATPKCHPSGRLTLTTLSLAFFMVILDTTIVNVALPTIERSLGATVTGLQWVVDGFTLVFAALLLSAGALGDRWGSRRVFIWGLMIFTAGSGLAAGSPVITWLVGARLVQGLGAAMVLPASLALIAVGFPDPQHRARALGVWAAVAGIATALGPVVGGLLIAVAGWRAIFLVNLPIGVLGLLLARRSLTETPRHARPIDLPGQITATVGLVLVTLALVNAGSDGWASPQVIGTGLLGLGFGALFLVVERRTRVPILPAPLFARPTFSAANLVGGILNFGIYGQVFVLSLYFQHQRGLSALTTGLALLPFASMTMIGPVFVGRLVARVGPWRPMVLGQLLMAVGTIALALSHAETPYADLIGGLVALGVGMALTMPSMTAAAVQAAPVQYAGVASGMLNTARQIGGALGVAVLGSFLADSARFMRGLHLGLALVAAVFLAGTWVAARYGAMPSAAREAVARGDSLEENR